MDIPVLSSDGELALRGLPDVSASTTTRGVERVLNCVSAALGSNPLPGIYDFWVIVAKSLSSFDLILLVYKMGTMLFLLPT